jgi:hypothetical protein
MGLEGGGIGLEGGLSGGGGGEVCREREQDGGKEGERAGGRG